MTDRELMQQALEVLKSTGLFLHHCWCDVQMNEYSFDKLVKQMDIVDAQITALRERLAREAVLDRMVANAEELGLYDKPVQEPMAWRYKKEGGGWYVSDNEPQYVEQWNDIEEIQPLYTTPPRREWVGLTDEDVTSSHPYSITRDKGCFHAGAKWADANLREKNT